MRLISHRMTTRAFILATSAFLIFSTRGQCAEKQAIQSKYAPGIYRLTFITDSNNTTIVGTQQQQNPEMEKMVWRLTVPAADDQGNKNATLRLIELTEAANGKDLWNSSQPDQGDQALAFFFQPIMVTDVQIQFDADDTVVQVSGLDQVITDTAAKATTDEQRLVAAQHMEALGDKVIENEFRTIETLLPRNPVAPGDKWQAGLRADLPMVGELKSRFQCTLQDVSDGAATIAAHGIQEISRPKSITIQGQNATLTKVSVNDDIALKIDTKANRVQSLVGHSTGEIDISAKDQNGADVAARVNVDSKDTLTLEPQPTGPAVNPLANPG